LPNPGFTLAEDAALKQRLATLYVSDDRDMQRPLQVFFRYPEAETEKHYPFATIELLDIAYARDRQESERRYYYTNVAGASAPPLYSSNDSSSLTYFPSEMNASDMQEYWSGDETYLYTDQLVPVNLMYQVSTYCRSQRHDRELTAALLRYVFPFRRGFIEIPEDGTIRRCDILDWRSADLLDQESGYKKRIFRKVVTVQINAEIPQSDLVSVKRVLSVNGSLGDNYSVSDVLSTSFSEDF
jgi:hypothetical protein